MNLFANQVGLILEHIIAFTEEHGDLKTAHSMTEAELEARREGRGKLIRFQRRVEDDKDRG
jgi:hypothetical protein